MFIQFLEYASYSLLFLSTNLSWNTAILLSVLLLLMGMAGLVFGLLLSIVTQSVMASLMLSQIFVYPVSFISGELCQYFLFIYGFIDICALLDFLGIMWPFEGVPTILQFVGYVFPFALPITAFRSILVKDLSICNPTVYYSILVLSAWVVLPLCVCFWCIRERRKSGF